MIRFDSKGLLTPKTNILTSLTEMKQHFVDGISSDTRLENFGKYVRYSDELKKMLNVVSLKQWINGSFVTKINNPSDIDLVTFIDFDMRLKLQIELQNFEAKGANDIYVVDAYLLTVFPENHLKSFLFQSDRAYWMERFSRTRRDSLGKKNPKGFLEINY